MDVEAISNIVSTVTTWLVENQVAIYAGMVSSGIVVVSQTSIVVFATFLSDILSKRNRLRSLFRFASGTRVQIVSGRVQNLRNRDYKDTVLLAAADAEGAVNVKNTLAALYKSNELVHTYCTSFPPELLIENIVTVGGPKNNSVTKSLLEQLTGGRIFFEELEITTPKVKYGLIHSGDGGQFDKVTDFGIVVVGNNPFDEGRRALVVAGCDTNGVLAAANCLQVGSDNRKVFWDIWRRDPIWHMRRGAKYFVVRASTVGVATGKPVLEEVGVL